jgi:hypothetical protein
MENELAGYPVKVTIFKLTPAQTLHSTTRLTIYLLDKNSSLRTVINKIKVLLGVGDPIAINFHGEPLSPDDLLTEVLRPGGTEYAGKDTPIFMYYPNYN